MEQAPTPLLNDDSPRPPQDQPVATGSTVKLETKRDAGLLSLPQLKSVIDSIAQEEPLIHPSLLSPQLPPTFYVPNSLSEQIAQSDLPQMMSSEASRQLDVTDALSYLDAVKEKFQDRPNVYNYFLDIMKDFKSQDIDTPGVIDRVSMLFRGHAELIQGFNTFLPPGYRIECSASTMESSLITVTTPSGTITQTRNEGLHDIQHDVLISPSPAPPLSIPQPVVAANPALIQGPGQLQAMVDPRPVTPLGPVPLGYPPSSPFSYGAVAAPPALVASPAAKEAAEKAAPPGSDEFNHAIQFVNKIKMRYENDPETYKRFLEILHAYRKEQSDDDTHVYAQVQMLFRDAPDLLTEFKDFLPSAHPNGASRMAAVYGAGSGPAIWNILEATANSEKRLIKGDGAGPSTATIATTKRKKRVTEKDVAVPVVSTSAGPHGGTGRSKKIKHAHKPDPPSPGFGAYQSHPSSPVPEHARPQTYGHGGWNAQGQPQAGTSTSIGGMPAPPVGQSARDELAFFDRAKRALESRDAYDEFLKLLDMFTKEIINIKTLIQRVELVLVDAELMAAFKALLGWDDKKESGQSGPPGAIRSYPQAFPAGYDEIGERHGPSYRCLALEEQTLACSGRDELCRSVLNDTWVSHPTWASEESGFVSHKKNSYEEALHKSEEERHEYQFYIDITTRTISLLQPIHDRIIDMTAEERNIFRLPPDLGGPTKSIYYRAIKKVYGRDAAGMEVLQALQECPAIAVPVILSRLKQKNEEWRRAQREWNRVWREVDARNFYKSLDHQGITFKANDKKNITTKNFVAEIEHAKAEMEEKGLGAAAFCHSTGKNGGNLDRISSQPSAQSFHQFEYRFEDLGVLQDAMKLVFSYLDRSAVQYTPQERRVVERSLRSFVLQLCMLPPEFDAALGTPLEHLLDAEEASNEEMNGGGASAAEDNDEGRASPRSSAQKNDKRSGGSGVSAGDLRKQLLKTSRERAAKSRSGSRSRQPSPALASEDGVSPVSPNAPGPSTHATQAQPSASEYGQNDEWTKLMHMDVNTSMSGDLSEEDLKVIKDGIIDHRPFFANTTFYTVLRLLQILYSRLLMCKNTADRLSSQRPNVSVFFINPVAEELGLADSAGPGAVLAFRVVASQNLQQQQQIEPQQSGYKKKERDRDNSATASASERQDEAMDMNRPEKHFYAYMLEACEKLFEGDMDQATFEENMRFLFGTKAFFLFTLDKLLQVLIKQVQSMATDNKCQELFSLLQKWSSMTEEQHTIRELIRYRHEAEQYLNQDDHLYSVDWVPDTQTMQIRLLGSLAPDPSVLPPVSACANKETMDIARWRIYVDSYTLRFPTENVDVSVRNRMRRPFLTRTREDASDDSSNSEGGGADGRQVERIIQCEQEVGIRFGTYRLVYKHNTEDFLWRRRGEDEESELRVRAAAWHEGRRVSSWLKP